MTRLSTISVLVVALILVRCSDFLDNTVNDSTQTLFYDGGELSRSAFSISVTARDLCFVDSRIGFIVGDLGAIYRTDDSGASWQKKTSGTNLPIVSVMFLNAQTGFATGYALSNCNEGDCNKGSVLLKTTDGGETWSRTFFAEYAAIFNVHFFDAQTALAIIHMAGSGTGNYNLARTTDGGNTWLPLHVAIRSQHEFQVIENTVLVAGEERKMFRSSDKGLTWDTIATPVPASRDLRGLYFFDKDLGFVDDSTQVYKTVDAGVSWEPVVATFTRLGVAHFWDENDGINIVPGSAGGTAIYVTTNGGESWTNAAGSDVFHVMKATFPDNEVGYGINLSELYTIRNK